MTTHTTTQHTRGIGRRGFLRGLAAVAVAAIAGPVLGHARALPGAVGVTVTLDDRTGVADMAARVDEAVERIRASLHATCHRLGRVTVADVDQAIRRAMGDAADVVECVQAEDGSFQVRTRLRDIPRLIRYTSNIPGAL